MLITRVVGKYKSVRWVTEDGQIYRFKRKLKKKQNLVFMMCANKDCRGTSYVKFKVPYENNPETGELTIVKDHSPGLVCRNPQYAKVEKLRWAILSRAISETKELSVIFQEEINSVDSDVASQLDMASMTSSMKRARKSGSATEVEVHEGTGTLSIDSEPCASTSNMQYGIPEDPAQEVPGCGTLDVPELGQTGVVSPTPMPIVEKTATQIQDLDGVQAREKQTGSNNLAGLMQIVETNNISCSASNVKIKPINTLQARNTSGKAKELKTKVDVQTSNVDVSVKTLESAIQRLESVSDKLTTAVSLVDCYDQFGKYISTVLRGLPMKKVHALKQKIIREITEVLAQEESCPPQNERNLTSELRSNFRRFVVEPSQTLNLPLDTKSSGTRIPTLGNMPPLYSSIFTPGPPVVSQVPPSAMTSMGGSASLDATPTIVRTTSSNVLPLTNETSFQSVDESFMRTIIPTPIINSPFAKEEQSSQSSRGRKRRKTTAYTSPTVPTSCGTSIHGVTTCDEDFSTGELPDSATHNTIQLLGDLQSHSEGEGDVLNNIDPSMNNEEQDFVMDIEEGGELARIKADKDLFETVTCDESSSLYIKEEAPDPDDLPSPSAVTTTDPATDNTKCHSRDELVTHLSSAHPGCSPAVSDTPGGGYFGT